MHISLHQLSLCSERWRITSGQKLFRSSREFNENRHSCSRPDHPPIFTTSSLPPFQRGWQPIFVFTICLFSPPLTKMYRMIFTDQHNRIFSCILYNVFLHKAFFVESLNGAVLEKNWWIKVDLESFQGVIFTISITCRRLPQALTRPSTHGLTPFPDKQLTRVFPVQIFAEDARKEFNWGFSFFYNHLLKAIPHRNNPAECDAGCKTAQSRP